MELNLTQLRAFYFAATCGSISRAAEELFISQPAVSMHIRALEDHYGIKLFIRKKKRLELTESGKKLYEVAEKVFQSVREAEEMLLQESDLVTYVLRIGSTKTLVRYFLGEYIARFRETFPKIQIQIDEGSSEKMVRSVLENRNDLAITGRVPYDSRLKIIPFIQDELVLLAAPTHPLCRKKMISIEDLQGENVILREKGSGTREVIQGIFKARGIVPSSFIEAGNVDFIKELVKMGKGITLLARMGVDPDLRRGDLRALPLREGPLVLDIDIVISNERKLSKADDAFLDILMSGKAPGYKASAIRFPKGSLKPAGPFRV
jgi:DNA-binding transcriptional LysR family regulator